MWGGGVNRVSWCNCISLFASRWHCNVCGLNLPKVKASPFFLAWQWHNIPWGYATFVAGIPSHAVHLDTLHHRDHCKLSTFTQAHTPYNTGNGVKMNVPLSDRAQGWERAYALEMSIVLNDPVACVAKVLSWVNNFSSRSNARSPVMHLSSITVTAALTLQDFPRCL